VAGPFGEVRWGCGAPPESSADLAWVSDDACLFAWERPPFLVELKLLRREVELPEGMRVDEAWIGYWRLRSDTAAAPPPLTCWIARGLEALDGGGDPGEHLDAQTWENDRHRVSIGTEDSEALLSRLGRGVPESWEADLRMGFEPNRPWYPVTYTDDGLTLDLAEVPAGMVCEFHHAVAWQEGGKDGDVSTWFAIDLIR
jgi:hypothetical protein